ncbi:MAG TPA: riboflavin synthase [Arenimonas sp.]|nr:riboflavin synthase [Arenimonas sp.]HPW32144.1 riboflavin synthase [Arenimonas sp.]
MFTGIIQTVGHVQSLQKVGGDVRLSIEVNGLPMHDVELGESIAVSGVCLTVVAFDANYFAADVSNETLSRTTLGNLVVGDKINLERALQASSRIGGHWVSGHVDGVALVESISDDARSQRWRFAADKSLLRYIAEKGSVAVNGVSLTVNQADFEGFEVNLVPHTVEHTNFSALAKNSPVNIEVDLMARYVERLMQFKVEEIK